MSVTYTIQRATPSDSFLIAYQRAMMFNEHGSYEASELAEMQSRYADWVSRKLHNEEYVGWFARTETSKVIAGAGLWLREWPPILNDSTGYQGYIENVYVLPGYRREGIARALVTALLNWARASERVFYLELHATSIAESLYSALGFESDDGLMTLWIGPKHHD